MQRTWLWVLFGLLLLTTIAYALLYFTRAAPIEEKLGVRLFQFGREEREAIEFLAGRDPDASSGEVVVKESTPGIQRSLGESGSLGIGSVALLTIEKITQDTIRVNSQEFLLLNIAASLVKDRQVRTLSIPIIDSIELQRLSAGQETPATETRITALGLKRGQQISVSFFYIPEDNPLSQNGIRKLCDLEKNLGCLYAIEQGWGTSPVDLSNYIETLFRDGEASAEISYQYAIPFKVTIYE